jgi:hypothetical protein
MLDPILSESPTNHPDLCSPQLIHRYTRVSCCWAFANGEYNVAQRLQRDGRGFHLDLQGVEPERGGLKPPSPASGS